jgi:hypothetical protein
MSGPQISGPTTEDPTDDKGKGKALVPSLEEEEESGSSGEDEVTVCPSIFFCSFITR